MRIHLLLNKYYIYAKITKLSIKYLPQFHRIILQQIESQIYSCHHETTRLRIFLAQQMSPISIEQDSFRPFQRNLSNRGHDI